MSHIPHRIVSIRIQWVPVKGTAGARGHYEVTAEDLRLPRSWDRKWKLFRAEMPEFSRRSDEIRWAIACLNTRLNVTPAPQPPLPTSWEAEREAPWQFA